MEKLTGAQAIEAIKKQVSQFEKDHAEKSHELRGGNKIDFLGLKRKTEMHK